MVDLSFSELSVIKLHKLFSCVTLKIQSTQFLAVFRSFVCFFSLRGLISSSFTENFSCEKPSWQDRDNQISHDG